MWSLTQPLQITLLQRSQKLCYIRVFGLSFFGFGATDISIAITGAPPRQLLAMPVSLGLVSQYFTLIGSMVSLQFELKVEHILLSIDTPIMVVGVVLILRSPV